MLAGNGEPSLFQILLELQRIRLDGDVQIANRCATDNVSNGASGKKNRNLAGAATSVMALSACFSFGESLDSSNWI